jgi:hypothetical protein
LLDEVAALKREKAEKEKKGKKVRRPPRPAMGDKWESGGTFRFLWEALYELVLNKDSVLWEQRALEAELALHQLPDSDPNKTAAWAVASNCRASAHRAKEAQKVRQALQHLKATKSAREYVQASSKGSEAADPSTSREKTDRKVESAARTQSIFGKEKLAPPAKVTVMNVKPDDLPNLARLASKNKHPVREYQKLTNTVWAYADILLTRVSHIGVRVSKAARGAFRASLKMKDFFAEEEVIGDGEVEEDEDLKSFKGKERCMVNIGMLRRWFFVTQVTGTDLRSRNASRGAKIARQMDDIYHNTLLNLEINEQAELTRVVPLFLADFWRNLELQDEAGVYRSPRKPVAVLDAMLAEHSAEEDPDVRRDKAVLNDNRVVFWACVLLGGCSDANARIFQMFPPAPPVEASGVFASRFGFHHLTGPAPQIHTLERFVPIEELYDSDRPAADEDNDGYFVPPDVPGSDTAARSHSFDDLYKLFSTKKHKRRTIRDYGFDGVEMEESGALPVRTAPVRTHEQDVHRAQAGPSSRSPLSQLYQEYLLLVPAGEPETTTLFQRGVSVKRRIQSISLFMRSLPWGADAYGRPVCKTTFSSNILPWQMKCNAAAQLLHGLAFPSLLSRKKVSQWCAQYFGNPYVLPSVYTPTPVVRYLHERLFYDAIHSRSEDGQEGRGLFAYQPTGSDIRSARELPLLPAWYRNHKNDKVLLEAHKKLTERVSKNPPLATPCIWHLWSPKKVGRGKSPTTPPKPCLVMCNSLSDLYKHPCSARRARGGDVYQLYDQLGQFCQPVEMDLSLPLVERGAVPVDVPLRAKPWNFFDQRSHSASPPSTATSPVPSPARPRAAKRKAVTGAKSDGRPKTKKKQSRGGSGARGKGP